MRYYKNSTAKGSQDDRSMMSSSPPSMKGYQAPFENPDNLNFKTRAADLRWKIMGYLDTLPRLRDKVPSDSLLEDVNATLHTISSRTIIKTNKLM